MSTLDFEAARLAEIEAISAGLQRVIAQWQDGYEPKVLRTAILELAKRSRRVGDEEIAAHADALVASVARCIPETVRQGGTRKPNSQNRNP